MWRDVAPHFEQRWRVVLFDHVGAGGSDLSAYDKRRYDRLHGYAEDLVEIVRTVSPNDPVVFVGHSVSAMVGMLADLAAPDLFAAHVMIGPSPSYINDGDYVGGFAREDIESMLETLEGNYLGWSSSMAPAIMGAHDQPELGTELTNSFCRTDPEIAAQFARVTFLSDNRADLPRLHKPTLILQCTEDLIAPQTVGRYLQQQITGSRLTLIDNVGHCPHMSEPAQCIAAMEEFLSDVEGSTS
jgi:sigma-B regulation protein RsbQ